MIRSIEAAVRRCSLKPSTLSKSNSSKGMNIAKSLRTPNLKIFCERLFLKFSESVFWSWNITLNLLWKRCFMCLVLVDCPKTFVIRLTKSWQHFYFSGYLIMHWWKRILCMVVVLTRKLLRNEDMLSNNVNFVYLKVHFAEPKNEFSIISSISFFHYESQKN